MKTAIIDLDDVIAIDGYLGMLNDFSKRNYTYEDTGSSYYVEEVLSKEELIEFRKFIETHNVYDYASLAPYVETALKNIMLEYEIYIASAYNSELDNIIMPDLIPRKCEFLMSRLPFLTTKNFIFINNKHLLKADLRIDDKVSNLSSDGMNILFTAYHNKDIEDQNLNNNIIRANNWEEVENIVLKQKVFTNK